LGYAYRPRVYTQVGGMCREACVFLLAGVLKQQTAQAV
jgi:hypothetical protein